MDKFVILAIGFDRIELLYLKHLTENEYKDKILYISSGVTGSKKNQERGIELGRYLQKSCVDCSLADANLGPIDAKCESSTLDILTEPVKTFFLPGCVIIDIHIMRLELFLFLFTVLRSLFPTKCALYYEGELQRNERNKVFTYFSKKWYFILIEFVIFSFTIRKELIFLNVQS